MTAFGRQQTRLFCRGICLNAPQDAMPEGKYPLLQNVRSYQEGTITARLGLTTLANGALGAGAIHSIARLNDPTPFAAASAWRVFGKGAAIFAGAAAYPQIDTGYSGNPLSLVLAAPVQAPNPYVYVGDSSRMRKFDVNGHVYPIGIAPPLNAPSAVTGFLYTGFVFDTGAAPPFIAAGVAAGAVATIFRINTNITSIFYDSGATGNASVVPVLFDGISTSAMIVFNGIESVPVLQTCVKVATTSIAAILYDAGTTGLCTIQPTASLGTGQVEAPPLEDYLIRDGAYAAPPGTEGTPPAPDPAGTLTNTIRQVDFPVNCLITLGGAAETVRILSVAVGPDGVQSFRCSTANTHAAADTITGVASFRVCTAGTYAAGNTLQAAAFSNIVTPPAGPPPQTVGGIQSPGGWTVVNNLAQIVGRATQPDDDLHLSVRLSNCTAVDAIRVYFDVDSGTNDYTRNYYFFEWRSSDIIAAIQSANTSPVSTVQTARAATVSNIILDQPVESILYNTYGETRNAPPPAQAGQGVSAGSVSDPLAAGNSQWLDLACKIGQLTRIGTDPSRTLGNILAAEVVVLMHGAAAVQTDYAGLWVSGGFGPDVGALYVPYVYAYRYRSSTTGAMSNPSPSMRAGVIPRRQQVTLTGVQSADAQCDLVDWFRFGGSLQQMTYVGTSANSATPSFVDTFRDMDIAAGPQLEYTRFQPWATTDKARTGTCTVVGNALLRTGGTDSFNTSWAPGTPVVINGRTYTLAAQPTSTTLAFLNENAGSGTGLTFTVPVPTLLQQNLPSMWGPNPIDGTVFACGDPNNPGAVYWTYPNDADRTSDASVVIVTSGSEPMQHGCLWDDISYVFSSDNLYQMVRNGAGWVAQKTPCGRGLWTRQGLTAASPRGIYFVTRDGIALTSGGSPAELVTDKDLSPLFPHDGTAGIAVNGFNPPDYTNPTRMHLSYVNGWLYFDYVDTAGAGCSLALRESDMSWWPDLSTPAVSTRLSAPGPQVYEELIGGADGTIYTPGGFSDNGTGIACKVRALVDQGDARRQKLYRDVMVDADLTGGPVLVTVTGNNGVTAFGSQTIGPAAGRQDYLTNILPGQGLLGTNLQTDLTWTPAALKTPLFYVVDVAYQPQLELATSWLSGYTTHGLQGFQTASGIFLAYLATAAVTVTVLIDGTTYTYTLPSTGGIYAKTFLWFQAVKGTTFQYGVQSTAPCLVFADDTEVWVTPFGGQGYQKVRPFAMPKAS